MGFKLTVKVHTLIDTPIGNNSDQFTWKNEFEISVFIWKESWNDLRVIRKGSWKDR